VAVGCVVDGGTEGGFAVLGGVASGSASVGSVSRIGAVGRGLGLGASVPCGFAGWAGALGGVTGAFAAPFCTGAVVGG